MTREQLARIALRYDTTMSRAMLRALGLPAPERGGRGVIIAVDAARAGTYADVRECMGQRYGVRL